MPRRPKCILCPLTTHCQARAAGLAETLPGRSPKPERPTRRAVAFWIVNPAGEILLRRRPEKGLLGGMMEVPSTDWREAAWPEAEAHAQAPLATAWTELPGLVRHTFTHFHFEITVWAARAPDGPAPAGGRWAALDTLGDEALPSVMRKIVKHALAQAGKSEDMSNKDGPD